MSEPSGPILLDTNVVLLLVRGGAAGQRLDGLFGIRARPERPLLSIVSIAEARVLARHRSWGEAKTQALEALLRELVILDVSHERVLDRYAEFRVLLRARGKALSDNDVWIAACAAAAGATLLTTDRDFEALADVVSVEWIDPTTLLGDR